MTRVRLAFHCLTLALAAAAGWALNMHTTTQQLASRQPGRQQKGAAVRARAAVRNVLVMAVLQRFFGVFAGCFFKTGVTFFLDQSIRLGRLSRAWPPGCNHGGKPNITHNHYAIIIHLLVFLLFAEYALAESKAVYSVKLHLCVNSH